jgi:hypothetical protein
MIRLNLTLLACLMILPMLSVAAEHKKPVGRTINQVAALSPENFSSLQTLARELRERNFPMTTGGVPSNSSAEMLQDDEWRSLNPVESEIIDVLVPFNQVSARVSIRALSAQEADDLVYLFGVLLSIDGSPNPAGFFLDTYVRSRPALDAAIARLAAPYSRNAIRRYIRVHLVVDQDPRR